MRLGFEYQNHRIDCMDGVAVDAVKCAVDELLSLDDHRHRDE